MNFLCCGSGDGIAPATAGTRAAAGFLTNPIVAAFDHQRLAVDDGVGNLEACLFVDFGRRRAGDLHLLRALIVGALFKVDDSNRFVLFNEQNDRFSPLCPLRGKETHERFTANATTTTGSGHTSTLKHRFRQMSESSIARIFEKSLLFSYFAAKPFERRNSKMNGRRSRSSTPPMPLVQESLRGERLRVAK